jgi:hypothetical protein
MGVTPRRGTLPLPVLRLPSACHLQGMTHCLSIGYSRLKEASRSGAGKPGPAVLVLVHYLPFREQIREPMLHSHFLELVPIVWQRQRSQGLQNVRLQLQESQAIAVRPGPKAGRPQSVVKPKLGKANALYRRQSSPGITRRMNSSNNGTVKAVSP